MKRLVIITVGKTHSGKTTFAKALEQELPSSIVIDQDNHAEFINTYYRSLLPKQGSNTIKYAITQTMVDYTVNQTHFHLILCNSNRSRIGRSELLGHFHNKGFISILVNFDIPDDILQERVANSQRSKAIFRSASAFEEVLARQQVQSDNETAPIEGEADYLFVTKNSEDALSVIHNIAKITQSYE